MTYEEFLAGLNNESNGAVSSFFGTSMRQASDENYIDPTRYSYMDPEDNPADRLYADIIRAQLRDYQDRYVPVEDFLVGNITQTGTAQLGADLERTRQGILQARGNATGQSQRFRSRYGLNPLEADASRINSTVSSLVGGANTTRQRDADRQRALLSGGLGAIAQNARTTS